MGLSWTSQLAYEALKQAESSSHHIPRGVSALGLYSNSIILTDEGPARVADLTPWARVATFDDGFQPVQGVVVQSAHEIPDALPFQVPEGVLGNDLPMTLPPDATVLMESDRLEDETGDPFVTTPIAALEGLAGVHRTTLGVGETRYALCLPKPQLINVGGGAFVCMATERGHDSFRASAARLGMSGRDLAEERARAALLFGLTPGFDR